MRQPDETICAYFGRTIRSSAGPPLGRIEDVLADARSRVAQWVVIRLPGPAPRYRALPLFLLIELDRGLMAPVSTRTLRRAPKVALGAALTAQQELALRRYWVDH